MKSRFDLSSIDPSVLNELESSPGLLTSDLILCSLGSIFNLWNTDSAHSPATASYASAPDQRPSMGSNREN